MFNYRTKTAVNGTVNGANREVGGRTPAQSVGSLLRERREALGATLAEVEAATRIRQKYLSALESDEWQLLPGEVIGRGFLRNYSGYLGLESTELVERRRAVTDPKLASVLLNTSAGASLPAERVVDYRPREVDLRDDEEQLEDRQIQIGSYLRGAALVAIVAFIGWSVLTYRQQVVDRISTAYAAISEGVGSLVPARSTATPLPSPPAEVAPALVPTATATQLPVLEQSPPAAPAEQEEAAPIPLPTPTDTPPPPPAPTSPPTATSAPQLVTLTTDANLRSGPGTDFDRVGAGQVGQQIAIIGRSADGQWYKTDSNVWVFGQLLANPPADVPVVGESAAEEAIPTPTAQSGEPTATPQVEPTPTSPPQPPAAQAPPAAVSPPACPDPSAVITSPGINQVLRGTVTINGTANRDPFDYYKIEISGAFIGPLRPAVVGGVLGSIDTTTLSNGPTVLIVTTVDLTGNYSVCAAPVIIQN